MKNKKGMLILTSGIIMIAIIGSGFVLMNKKPIQKEKTSIMEETTNGSKTTENEIFVVEATIENKEVEEIEKKELESELDNDNISKSSEPVKQVILKNKPIPDKTKKEETTSKTETEVKEKTEEVVVAEPVPAQVVQEQEQVVQTNTNEKATLSYSTNGTIGDDLSFTGSIYLPNAGINVPTLNKFNYAGLAAEETWAGDDSSNQIVRNNMQTIIYSAEDFNAAYDNIGVTSTASGRFAIDGYAIYWNFFGWGPTSDMELFRKTELNEYILSVNMEIKPGTMIDGTWDLSMYGQDVLLYLCTLISSKPQLLYDTIYEDLYGDLVFNEQTYVEVGDCLVRVDPETSASHYVYRIRQK